MGTTSEGYMGPDPERIRAAACGRSLGEHEGRHSSTASIRAGSNIEAPPGTDTGDGSMTSEGKDGQRMRTNFHENEEEKSE